MVELFQSHATQVKNMFSSYTLSDLGSVRVFKVSRGTLSTLLKGVHKCEHNTSDTKVSVIYNSLQIVFLMGTLASQAYILRCICLHVGC